MLIYGRSHLVRLAGAVYPPLVLLTIVVTGNHFILDAVAGIAVLAAGFAVAVLFRRREREDRHAACVA